MSDKPRVVCSRPLPGAFEVPDADVRHGPARGFGSREELFEFVRGAAAFVSWVSDRVDDALLEAAGENLRIVANFAVGYDNVDTDACARRGVIVSNTPDAVTEGTADAAWTLLLAAARRLIEGDRFARSGAWAEHGILGPTDFIGRPIAGRTLLIVGAGRIGYATALRSLGWGMRIRYVARSRKPAFEQAPLNARRVGLDEGLREADFVSIHTPLTDETRHLFDARRLALMKETAVLVNTARGPVVDEAALAEALREKRIFAAGLDVFEREPEVHAALTELENAVMTPHYGSASSTSREEMTALCAANVRAALAGERVPTPVVDPRRDTA